MPELLAVAYAALLALLAWRHFRLALAIFILSFPAYLIRLQFFGLPSTLLEVGFGAISVVWLCRYAKTDWLDLKKIIRGHLTFFVALAVFLLSSITAIYISDMRWFSFGQWRAYLLEPIIFFIILLGRRYDFNASNIAAALLWSGISISLVAVAQATTGHFYPPSLWDDALGGRATGFFTSPNAAGLYLGPLVLLGAMLILHYYKLNRAAAWLTGGAAVTIVLGLAAARSLGAFLSVMAGLIVAALCYAKRRRHRLALGALLIIMTAGLLTQGKTIAANKLRSFNNRVVLWGYSIEFLTANPKNFIFGAGLRQFFRKIQKPHYNAAALERLIYPHNFWLNFWTETGLAGMIAITYMVGYVIYALWRSRHAQTALAIGFFGALVVVLTHGLIDVPYFKNDLAMLFWALLAGSLALAAPHTSRANHYA